MIERIPVRRLRQADLERIQEIEQASFGEDAYDRNLFAEFYHTCGDLFLVAERERRVCGYMITRIGGRGGVRQAELVSLAVDPAARGLGAASALLASTLRRLRARGVGGLRLMVRLDNRPARAFYDKWGFRRVKIVRRYYEDGADGLAMARPVRAPREPAGGGNGSGGRGRLAV